MKLIPFVLLFFLFSHISSGQAPSFLQEIKQDSALDLYLTLNWKEMERHKHEKVYMPAEIDLQTPQGDSLSMNAKVRTRGHMRLEICGIPPIKLKLDKKDLEKHSLSSLNEMDLVSHCQEGDQYDQYLLKEFMAYKLFELISPYCFHVQLVKMHYENPEGEETHHTSYAFIVENQEELTSRLNAKLNKNTVVSPSAIDHETFLKVCLFQFMIGNTDWYIPTRHNLEFIGAPPYKLLVAVPFDFDYAGLVDAQYAVPHESLNLSAVNVRYYQGWCQSEEEVNKALQVFRDQKETILGMCDHIQGFNERSVKQTREYLQNFFDIIENPKKLQSQIIKHCDLWPIPN